jgi:hypothetical protein
MVAKAKQDGHRMAILGDFNVVPSAKKRNYGWVAKKLLKKCERNGTRLNSA